MLFILQCIMYSLCGWKWQIELFVNSVVSDNLASEVSLAPLISIQYAGWLHVGHVTSFVLRITGLVLFKSATGLLP